MTPASTYPAKDFSCYLFPIHRLIWRGRFTFPYVGLVHRNETTGTIAAYRVFEMDPIYFRESVNLLWRNGETKNAYVKCHGGTEPVGQPQVSQVHTIAWVYEW